MNTKNIKKPEMSPALLESNKLFKEFNNIYHDAALKLGISNSSLDILYSICELGDGCLQRDISKSTFIPKQTIHSSIRSLEKLGYIYLSNGKGRNMHINLTDAGRDYIKETIYPIITLENEAISSLTEDERRQMLILQSKYITALREAFNKIKNHEEAE